MGASGSLKASRADVLEYELSVALAADAFDLLGDLREPDQPARLKDVLSAPAELGDQSVRRAHR